MLFCPYPAELFSNRFYALSLAWSTVQFTKHALLSSEGLPYRDNRTEFIVRPPTSVPVAMAIRQVPTSCGLHDPQSSIRHHMLHHIHARQLLRFQHLTPPPRPLSRFPAHSM